MTLAGDLLFVESALAGLAGGAAPEGAADAGRRAEFRRASCGNTCVLPSMRPWSSWRVPSDTILQYLEYPEQVRQLIDVPSRLHLVAGVLQMLELPEAGRLLGDLKFYVAALASGEEQAPDAQRVDALADVIVSAEL